MNKSAQSLLELLLQIPGLQLQIMPGLKPNVGLRTQDPKAKKLMSVWESVENKIADKKFKKPVTLSRGDITDLEASGYIQQQGDSIAITQKGSDLIKIMLLNDDSHAFDKKAGNIKSASVMHEQPKNWYKRL